MTQELQTTLSVGVPTITVLIGILVNNARLSDLNQRISDLRGEMNGRFDNLRGEINGRFDDVKDVWRSELRRVEEVLDAWLGHLEDRKR